MQAPKQATQHQASGGLPGCALPLLLARHGVVQSSQDRALPFDRGMRQGPDPTLLDPRPQVEAPTRSQVQE